MKLTLKEKAELFKYRVKGMELYAVSPRVFCYYRKKIHNNWKDDYITCCKKLYRNFNCGQTVYESEDKNIIIKIYGNLKIVVNTELHEIINLENIRGEQRQFKIDEDLKTGLNKKLGLVG